MIESELISHGVWPHIAEQITRFIVALQNPSTKRIIRDHVFEYIISEELIGESCTALNTTRERLLQQIELFIEGIDPQVVIFIDETNQDLYDIALRLVLESRKASVSYIQRRLKIGYARAGRVMDMMEDRGIVGPYQGSKPRDLRVDPDDFLGG